VETLTRERLTAALAARQLLLERRRLAAVDAVRLLTPLQAQDSPAPYVALAARLEGFAHSELEAALSERAVVKTTVMRVTLHLVARDDYLAYHELARQARMRAWRKQYAHLGEERIVAELRAWFAEGPRSNAEIREKVGDYGGVPDRTVAPIMFARTLLPLLQLPPAGFWRNRTRPVFALDDRPQPDPGAAAALVAGRYLEAFGPASKRDLAAWAGVAQRDFAGAWERLETVAYEDERGTPLLDLPGRPLPPADTPLPVRFLARWDQALLAYDDRDRIVPPELRPLKLTLSGDATVTVDGRVAASWKLDRGRRAVKVVLTPHREIRRSVHDELRAEAQRTARFCEPDAERIEVAGL
jgi:hypothetical protein